MWVRAIVSVPGLPLALLWVLSAAPAVAGIGRRLQQADIRPDNISLPILGQAGKQRQTTHEQRPRELTKGGRERNRVQ
jgi:hypothetical protein